MDFRFLITSLLFIAIHTYRHVIDKDNITPKLETNDRIIVYSSRRNPRFKNN